MRAIADPIFSSIQQFAGVAEPKWPQQLIGYTELSTNLPGGRHVNVRTMRANVVLADGSGPRMLAAGF